MKKVKIDMSLEEVMAELESYSSETTKNTLMKHGAREPFYGVKIGDMKKIVKKVKKDHELSLELYATGNSDAMYLAGLIADEKKISKEEIQSWADGAYWYMISEYTVPWIASESLFGYELASEWLASEEERIISAGWSTFAALATLKDDVDLDLDKFDELLDIIAETIHDAPNRVRYAMNTFVITCGASVQPLAEKAMKVAEKIGKVSVDMGGTACKVPLASDYIQKIIDKGNLGKKKKTVRC